MQQSATPSFPPSPKEDEVFFPSTEPNPLRLQGRLHRGEQDWACALCHPHPLHGGSMQNKVVDAAMRAAASCGATTLRFNFRGVGQSEGVHGHGKDELHDLDGAIAFLRKECQPSALLLIGFSFGTGVLSHYLAAGQDHHADGAILLAPPLLMNPLPTFPTPSRWGTHIIVGDQDEFCDLALLEEYVQSFDTPPRARVLSETDHFFHGNLIEIVRFVSEAVS